MKYFKYIAISILLLVSTSCGDSRVFDEVQNFTDDTWNANDTINFSVNISDTTSAYDILIHIRNDNSYEFSNLWMFIKTLSPNGAIMNDTVEFILAGNDGQWHGKGLGAVNTLLIPYKTNIRFPYRGIYNFSLQQAMRENTVHGIKDIGLRIQERQ